MPVMEPGKIWPGTDVRIRVTFKDEDGIVIDPGKVTFKVYPPCGPATSYVYGTDAQVSKTADGKYYGDVVPEEPGRWHYRWEALVYEVIPPPPPPAEGYPQGLLLTLMGTDPTPVVVETPDIIGRFAEEGNFIVQVSPFYSSWPSDAYAG